MIMLGGALPNFMQTDGFQHIAANYMLVCLGGVVTSVVAMFVQRFYQIASEKVLFGWLQRGQFRTIVLSSSVLIFAAGGLAVNQMLVSPTTMKQMLEYEGSELAQVLRYRTLVALD
ncbi:hypothetical protein AAVH_15548, partial [Aphelenchoides avenae]